MSIISHVIPVQAHVSSCANHVSEDLDRSSAERVSSAEMLESTIDVIKLLRKMDSNIIPILALLYFLSFLDRGSIGNARIQGLAQDLHLTGPQYNMARKCCPGRSQIFI